MVGIPNHLIGIPEEMANYNAQGPTAPTSADAIVSGLDGGKRFATAEKTAADRLIEYSTRADQGIRGMRFEAGRASDRYMSTELFNRAQLQDIVSPNVYSDVSERFFTPVEPQAPVSGTRAVTTTPLLGGV